ncbi:hypothetical protein CN476_00410 [Bacillus cereus]|nr:hypothetical protein CN476_00410 [Bacillus cereus]PGX12958.1 hypothetical protein COE07_09435 [Bacillus sp. AFS033286]PGZ69193.1 hypothetical protein COE49_22870 [Bacillus sp. AFS029637]
MLLFYKKRNVYVKTRRDMLYMSINIISIVSIIIWIVLITELIKPSKEQNGRKIVMLLTAGSASTLILTVSLIQNISFWN